MADQTRFLPAIVLGAGCAMLFGIREQLKMPPRAPMTQVQLSAPGYASTDIEVAEQEREVAGMSDYVMRSFQRDSLDPGFSVYVGYYDYQQQGKTIHSPKNCLPGAGWEQLSASVQSVKVGERAYPVNRYLLANKGAQALVYYWYQGRGRVEANEYRVKWNLLRDAALHGRTEEALVRIVVPLDLRGSRRTPAEMDVLYARADSLAGVSASQLIPEVSRLLPPPPEA